MDLLAASEVFLSVVTAGLLIASAWRVKQTRAAVSANALFNVCAVTGGVVIVRSGGTILAEAGIIDATRITTLLIRFVLLGVAVYIVTLANGTKHND